MRDWFAALAVGLVIVVGCAAGLAGTLAFLLTFGIAWYLFAARDLGFAQARDRLGIRLLPPIWRRDNWLWIDTLFDDGDRLLQAAAVALLVTAVALMFWPDLVYGAALLIAAFYVSEILRGNAGPRPRGVRVPDGSRHTSAIAQTAESAAATLSTPPRPALTAAIDLLPGPVTRFLPPSLLGEAPAAERLRRAEKRKPLRQRRKIPRKAAPQRSASAMRAQLGKAKPAPRAKPTLPSRKPDYPIASRPRQPRSPLRQRTMRKPAAQIGRGAPKPAAARKR
ncbi:hypothetical protein NML43_02425 [Rhodopseudomonas palustris]|uniref:hypothetical protein n=1 Tax=Rhodopseudomonas palustris TaxID=1076 RepID=UPI0020CBC807|nr:hypothetical protein [Rhodopseudomonas palustris]MCP9625938.1 hypothetical protein [Rhodopseudomonas palustris]